MDQLQFAQIRLRRAFRLSFRVFFALFVAALVLFGLSLWAAPTGQDVLTSERILIWGLAIGLLVPAYYLIWSLISIRLIGFGEPRGSLLEDITA